MEKHGPENWLEPLLEGLGPQTQLQLGDIANLLEVFQKSGDPSIHIRTKLKLR